MSLLRDPKGGSAPIKWRQVSENGTPGRFPSKGFVFGLIHVSRVRMQKQVDVVHFILVVLLRDLGGLEGVLLVTLLPVGDGLVATRARVLGAKQGVPEGEEGLGKVGLDAPVLVVDVVVGGVVTCDELEGVPGE